MTYQWIKSKIQIEQELFNLWENYPLYKFICGAQYIRKRELEICECLVDREEFIEKCRTLWSVHEMDKAIRKYEKKKPR